MDTSSSDPVLRDCRRYQLAARLMAFQARTRTVTVLTSLSRHQLARLRQRCRIPQDTRLRGPSPTSLSRFTHSPLARSEGAVLATFCRAYRVLPERTSPLTLRRNRQTLEFGEHLCAAYEAYRACFPLSEVAIEELLSLVNGIAENREIGLEHCPLCSGMVLIDHLARHGAACAHCYSALADWKEPVREVAGIESPGRVRRKTKAPALDQAARRAAIPRPPPRWPAGNRRFPRASCKISSVRTHPISSVEDHLISSDRTHLIS